jgi:hypothetical protein
LLSQASGESCHLCRFLLRNGTAYFVAAHVPFFAKSVKPPNHLSGGPNGERWRLYYAMMVGLVAGSVSGSRERCGRRLQSGIVGDGEPPIGG